MSQSSRCEHNRCGQIRKISYQADISGHAQGRLTMSSEVDFSQIYEEFQPKILHYLSRLTGQQEAEDIAQEVFEKASRGLKSFKGESKLSTWLYLPSIFCFISPSALLRPTVLRNGRSFGTRRALSWLCDLLGTAFDVGVLLCILSFPDWFLSSW